MKIDHIAIAVNNVEEAAKKYQQALGVDKVIFETVESEGVKLAILKLENARIELMEPTRDDSPIRKFLEKKGEGLHHMALPQTILTPNTKGWKDAESNFWAKYGTVLREPKLHSFIQSR